ncbi:MFS transporter [Streptomyces sp. NPDC058848]|uniref:MFS transporter n=1 Tax=unclassified Streptomyces TaxID=2593676 RepID=UPI0036826D72
MTATASARVATVRQRPAFLLLGGVQATLIFTLAAIAVPLPRIGRELGLQRADLILLSAAYGLTFAGLLLFGGRLADRCGGRRALTAGLVLFATASAAAPLAPGMGTLLAARFAQGAGAALIAPAAMAVLRAVFPSPTAYGRAMATWGGLSILGATAGNLLSGVISTLLSWRWTLAVPLVVALAALALTPRLLPDTTASRDRTLDLPGALLATTGITLASYGLVVTDTRPWSSAGVLVPLLGGAALLAGFWYAERRARDPLLPPRFLLDRRRVLALAAIALSACATAMTFVVLSLHLQQARDWSQLRTSAAFVPFAVVLIASGRAAGALIGRYGARTVTAAGLGTGAAGLVLLALTGTDAHIPYGYGLLPGLVLLPAGTAASFAGAAVLATEGVPRQRTGLAGGVLNTAMEFGPTVLFALLLTLGSDASSLAATGAALAAVALLNHRTR